MSIEKDHAEDNARAWLSSIVEMVAGLTLQGDDYEKPDHAATAIAEAPLSVMVRSGWYAPTSGEGYCPETAPAEYEILLTTGGPACRIIGELDGNCEPTTAELQKQDWGTPWTRVPLLTAEECLLSYEEFSPIAESRRNALLTFAQQFYYGEGE